MSLTTAASDGCERPVAPTAVRLQALVDQLVLYRAGLHVIALVGGLRLDGQDLGLALDVVLSDLGRIGAGASARTSGLAASSWLVAFRDSLGCHEDPLPA